MRTRTQLPAPRSPNIDHAHRLAVLFAEQRHGAELLGLVKSHLSSHHFEVILDGGIHNLFDVCARGGRKRLIPREVEAHVAGLVVRATLVGRLAQRLTQSGVHEVSCRVCLRGGSSIGAVNDRRGLVAHGNRSREHGGHV